MGWDLPNQIDTEMGERRIGVDYYQNMILWTLPAALDGKGLTGPCQTGGLVDRVLKAGIAQ